MVVGESPGGAWGFAQRRYSAPVRSPLAPYYTTDNLYSESQPKGTTEGTEKTLLFASKKACIRYLQVYHLLLCIMQVDPELRERALARLKSFCNDDRSRAKLLTPDLGKFMVMAAVVAGSHSSVQFYTPPISASGSKNANPGDK